MQFSITPAKIVDARGMTSSDKMELQEYLRVRVAQPKIKMPGQPDDQYGGVFSTDRADLIEVWLKERGGEKVERFEETKETE